MLFIKFTRLFGIYLTEDKFKIDVFLSMNKYLISFVINSFNNSFIFVISQSVVTVNTILFGFILFFNKFFNVIPKISILFCIVKKYKFFRSSSSFFI